MGPVLRAAIFSLVSIAFAGALSIQVVMAASDPAVHEASASRAELFPPPPDNGTALAVWSGGTIEELIDVAPSVASVFVTKDGELLGYIPGAPSFVNRSFLSSYPSGVLPPSTIVSVRLEYDLLRSRGIVTDTSQPSATPTSTPSPSPEPTTSPILPGGGSSSQAAPTPTPTVVPDYQLLVSLSPSRFGATPLAGASVEGDIYVFVGPADGIDRVAFYIDNPGTSGSPYRTEQVPAYDLGGTASNGWAQPFDADSLSVGTHSVSAVVELAGGGTEVLSAIFEVTGTAAPTPTPTPSPTPAATAAPTPAPTAVPAPPAANGVYIAPGQAIQSVVDSHPAGTQFVIGSGVHREQEIKPRSGDRFLAEPGAILNGSRVLSGFVYSSGSWRTTTATLNPFAHGVCLSGQGCRYRNDVFIDGVIQRQVLDSSSVVPGTFYMNYSTGEVRIGTSPVGKLVEMSTAWHAFSGSASNVTIEGFVIERYANPAQHGAIEGGASTSWTLRNNEIRWTHGTGIRTGDRMVVENNHVHHNGQLGIGGVGDDVLVTGGEYAYNNQLGFEPGWEGGGSKFVRTNRLVVRGTYVHHNDGTGLWTDIDNVNTLYENNRVEWNTSIGIRHEISYSAVIRGNTVAHNGLSFDVWLWGAQIAIQNSSDVEVVGNDVTVPASGGDGIAVLNQNRASGFLGPWVSERAWVHDNVVRYLGHVGQSGVVDDTGGHACTAAAGNRFDNNEYWTLDPTKSRWNWCANHNWNGFRSTGQEAGGTAH